MVQTNILLESGTNELEIVEFIIDEINSEGSPYSGHYGVNVAKVLEIIRVPDVTEMPETTHPCVMGAFNHRSQIIPLVDLSIWLDKPMQRNPDNKVIVTEFNHVVTGFLVSGVNRIHRISWQDVEAPDAQLSSYSGDSITGVVKFDDRIILILDMEKIIADLNPSLGMNVDAIEVGERSAEPCKIMIIDDSTMIRKTIGRGLESAGFDVEAHVHGQKAWEALLVKKQEALDAGRPITDLINIVVSDIEMPVMDGHNLTKRIKDDPVLRELPVILFSSLISESLRHKGEAVGADEQIVKPDIATVTNTARRLIQERQNVKC